MWEFPIFLCCGKVCLVSICHILHHERHDTWPWPNLVGFAQRTSQIYFKAIKQTLCTHRHVGLIGHQVISMTYFHGLASQHGSVFAISSLWASKDTTDQQEERATWQNDTVNRKLGRKKDQIHSAGSAPLPVRNNLFLCRMRKTLTTKKKMWVLWRNIQISRGLLSDSHLWPQ